MVGFNTGSLCLMIQCRHHTYNTQHTRYSHKFNLSSNFPSSPSRCKSWYLISGPSVKNLSRQHTDTSYNCQGERNRKIFLQQNYCFPFPAMIAPDTFSFLINLSILTDFLTSPPGFVV